MEDIEDNTDLKEKTHKYALRSTRLNSALSSPESPHKEKQTRKPSSRKNSDTSTDSSKVKNTEKAVAGKPKNVTRRIMPARSKMDSRVKEEKEDTAAIKGKSDEILNVGRRRTRSNTIHDTFVNENGKPNEAKSERSRLKQKKEAENMKEVTVQLTRSEIPDKNEESKEKQDRVLSPIEEVGTEEIELLSKQEQCEEKEIAVVDVINTSANANENVANNDTKICDDQSGTSTAFDDLRDSPPLKTYERNKVSISKNKTTSEECDNKNEVNEENYRDDANLTAPVEENQDEKSFPNEKPIDIANVTAPVEENQDEKSFPNEKPIDIANVTAPVEEKQDAKECSNEKSIEKDVESEKKENNINEQDVLINDIDLKIDQLLLNASNSTNTNEESEEERNSFMETMAEEGEEDTPSEGSNDIIDVGEEINTTESEIDPDDSYDKNSFIDDDDQHELLSGDEYDLSIEEMKKKRRRLIDLSSGSDDEIVRIERRQVEVVRRKSRIIRMADSSSESCEDDKDATINTLTAVGDTFDKNSEDQNASTVKTESPGEKELVADTGANEGIAMEENALQKIVIIENILLNSSPEAGAPVDSHITSDTKGEEKIPQDTEQQLKKKKKNQERRQNEVMSPPFNNIFKVQSRTNKKSKKRKNKKTTNFKRISEQSCLEVIKKSKTIDESMQSKNDEVVLNEEPTNLDIFGEMSTKAKSVNIKKRKWVTDQDASRVDEGSQEPAAKKKNEDNQSGGWHTNDKKEELKPDIPTDEDEVFKCSTSGQTSTNKFHVQDFKNSVLFNNKRIRRIDTKKRLKKCFVNANISC